MVIKKIAGLCKRSGLLNLYGYDEGEQWIGNGYALYSLYGAPLLNGDTAIFVLDLTEKDMEKLVVNEYDELPPGLDFRDVTENDSVTFVPGRKISSGGQELLAVGLNTGETYLFDPDYLEPLKDIREGLEWYARISETGTPYLLAASGWVPRAAILPKDPRGFPELPGDLARLAEELRRSLEAAEERERLRAEENGNQLEENQTVIDPETGEVGED